MLGVNHCAGCSYYMMRVNYLCFDVCCTDNNRVNLSFCTLQIVEVELKQNVMQGQQKLVPAVKKALLGMGNLMFVRIRYDVIFVAKFIPKTATNMGTIIRDKRTLLLFQD